MVLYWSEGKVEPQVYLKFFFVTLIWFERSVQQCKVEQSAIKQLHCYIIKLLRMTGKKIATTKCNSY